MSPTIGANMNNRKWILLGVRLTLSFALVLVGRKNVANKDYHTREFTCPPPGNRCRESNGVS